MQKKQKTIALAGASVAAAVALGLAGATLASAADQTSSFARTSTSSTATPSPGSTDTRPSIPPGGPRDHGGTLTADAASKAIAAAQAKVSGGTASGVRSTSSGTYVVEVLKSDGTEVHVLLDAKFAVTSVETGGPGGPGGPGGHHGHGGPPPSGTNTDTGSTSPSDANDTGTSST